MYDYKLATCRHRACTAHSAHMPSCVGDRAQPSNTWTEARDPTLLAIQTKNMATSSASPRSENDISLHSDRAHASTIAVIKQQTIGRIYSWHTHAISMTFFVPHSPDGDEKISCKNATTGRDSVPSPLPAVLIPGRRAPRSTRRDARLVQGIRYNRTVYMRDRHRTADRPRGARCRVPARYMSNRPAAARAVS